MMPPKLDIKATYVIHIDVDSLRIPSSQLIIARTRAEQNQLNAGFARRIIEDLDHKERREK